jgi:hypothetical protein
MLFSGELSMTRAGALLELLAPVEEEAVEEAPVEAVVDELLDEQAASPAAMRPAAVTASALLVNSLLVNFDCPLGCFLRRVNFSGEYISGGLPRWCTEPSACAGGYV